MREVANTGGGENELASGEKAQGFLGKLIFLLGIGMSLFHIYFSTIGLISTISVRSGHLIFAMAIIFLSYPLTKKGGKVRFIDWLFVFLACISGFYIIFMYPEMRYHIGNLTLADKICGVILIFLTVEITRRTIGLSLTLIALAALAYGILGPYVPGILGHRGYNLSRIISQMYCCLEGIYGIPLGVMATMVYLFVLFGAFLEKTGASEFFIDLAYALTGKYAGGPAKTALIASGLMGSVSGSAVANTVTTGSVTIPLMKSVGYKPEVAGGIEAAASTGGQLMPPLMGAGAFIMSEYTGIPYLTIITVSVIPALLYYLTLGFFVHNAAVSTGLKGMSKEQLPHLGKVLLSGWHLFVPLGTLIWLLVSGYSPTFSASISILVLIVVSMFRSSSRLSVRDFFEALAAASKMAVPISAACAAAGLVVGIVGLTGLGLKFSTMILEIAGNSVFIAMILVMFASLILGMGLPVTAAYIMLAVLAVPALVKLGITMLAAHLIVFWYSQDSNVTPPVCLAAYAGAGIAEANPMKTGFYAWKLSKGLYLIPFLFAYRPEILVTQGWYQAIIIGLQGLVALMAGVAALDGFLFVRLNIWYRLILGCICIVIFCPSLTLRLIGLFTFFGIFVFMFIVKAYSKMKAEKGEELYESLVKH